MSGERIELGNQQASAQPIQGDSFDRIVSETTQLFQILEDETFTQGNEFVTKSPVIDETLLLWRLQALKQSIEKSLEVLNKIYNEINYQNDSIKGASQEEQEKELGRRSEAQMISTKIETLERYLKDCHSAIKQREASLKKLGSISVKDWDRVLVTPESKWAYAAWYEHEKKGIPFRLYQEEVLEPVAQKKRPLSIAGRVLMALAVVALAVMIALIVAMPALLPATPLILGLAFGLPALTGVVGGALLYKGWDPEGREWSQEERNRHFGEWKTNNADKIKESEDEFVAETKRTSQSFSADAPCHTPPRGILKSIECAGGLILLSRSKESVRFADDETLGQEAPEAPSNIPSSTQDSASHVTEENQIHKSTPTPGSGS